MEGQYLRYLMKTFDFIGIEKKPTNLGGVNPNPDPTLEIKTDANPTAKKTRIQFFSNYVFGSDEKHPDPQS